MVFQALQHVDVGAQGKVDVQLAAAQFQAHDQFGHGFYRQRVERTQAEALGEEPRSFAGLAHHLLGVLDQLPGFLFQHVGAFQRDQLAAFVLEQRAAQGALQRVDGAVHADGTGRQLDRRAAEVAGAHEGKKGFQLFEGQFFVDQHGGLGGYGYRVMVFLRPSAARAALGLKHTPHLKPYARSMPTTPGH